MDALSQWPLTDLIDRVLKDRLVDECLVEEEYVIIVQGSTRFVLDHKRAHAFLRGVVRGMSPAFRGNRNLDRDGGAASDENPVLQHGEKSGLFDSFRRHLVRKWWGRYEDSGAPFGRSTSGLLLWIRYDSWTTVN
ncbi:MAG: hypothetical protein WD021_06045 [Rhodothermales bacterium]